MQPPGAVEVMDSAQEVPMENDEEIEAEAELTASITVYSQLDSRWKNHPYGYSNTAGTVKATIGSGGCGILALVNAIYYLNGNFIQPEDLADWSVKNGHRVNGVGTAHSLYPAYAKAKGDKYNFNCTSSTGDTSTSNLSKHLKKGGVVVASSTTLKTGGGHMMAIVDYNSETKKFLILDSYKSSNRFSATYSWQTINSSTLITGNGKVKFKKFIYISPKIPSKPTITSAEAVDETSIKIKWNAVAGAKEYIIYSHIAGGDYAKVGSTTGTSFTHKNLTKGELYWYKVTAKNDAGESSRSTHDAAYLQPLAPKVTTGSTTSLVVTWTEDGGNTRYELLGRKSGENNYITIANIDNKGSYTVTKYNGSSLIPGTQYYFKIVAHNQGKTDVVSERSPAGSAETKLLAPTITSNSSNSVSLKWERGSMNGEYTYTYRIYRDNSPIGTTSSKSYTDTTVKPNTKYVYRVVVLRNGTEIVDSETLTVTTPSCSHTYSAWTTTKAATCTASGTQTRTCTKCSATATGTIPATGHSFSAWTTTTAPTCTATGISTRTCSNCSAKETQTIAATGHNMSEWEVEKEATCFEKGLMVRFCTNSNCSVKYLESRETSAIGSHDYVEIERAEPTEVDGYVKYECSRCGDSYTDVLPVVVVSVTGVELNKEILAIEIGETVTLKATVNPSNATNKNVTWTSSDTSVATVENGVVTAIGEGSATITVTTEDGGKTATCEVAVNKAEVSVTSVTLDKSASTLEIGETVTLKATVNPSNATNKNVTWTSSDTSVATVENGVVTAIGEGSATITVTTEDGGKTATCEVTVNKKEEPDVNAKAVFTFPDVSGKPGETIDIRVSLKTEEAVNTIALSKFEYDKSLLTFEGFYDYDHIEDMSSLPPTFDKDNMAVAIALSENRVFDGDICTLRFTINPEATDGAFDTVSAVPCVKLSSVEYSSTVISSKVTVSAQMHGDIDGDEDVDIDDAVLLFCYSVLPEVYTIGYTGNIDFDKNGSVDIDDAVLLFRYSVLPELYPIA